MICEDFIKQAVEQHQEKILNLSDQIFVFAETGFQARFGSGQPVIALLAEYDALPGLSQTGGCTTRQMVEGNPDGHGCGHNLLGAGVFGAALALKEFLEQNPEKGSVVLFGCPSEEKGNGKNLMARDGAFRDVDAAFTWHPGDRNYIWSTGSLANISVHFDFKGLTAHAAATPHLGRSALDAAELMSVGVNYLREHIIPEARVHYAYIDVGGTAPNVVQGTSRVHYFIREPKTWQVLEIFERVKDVAKGAAHGNTSIAHKAVLAAAKALALASVQVMEDKDLQVRMKDEWKKQTNGQYVCPISDEVTPRLEG